MDLALREDIIIAALEHNNCISDLELCMVASSQMGKCFGSDTEAIPSADRPCARTHSWVDLHRVCGFSG